MINEANEPSSACRLWRIYKVETSTPPSKRNALILAQKREMVKDAEAHRACRAPDKNGATPLHRAVRTRSVEAVKCLLENGSNAMLKNKPGLTPFHLAVQNTGHGGTGADIAKAAQQLIIQTFLSIGLRPTLKDGNGKTVMESARSLWIRNLLARK